MGCTSYNPQYLKDTMLPTISKPMYSTLYDTTTSAQLKTAQQEFDYLLPTIVTQADGVQDKAFLEQLYFSESFIYAVQDAFGVTTSEGFTIVDEPPAPRSTVPLVYGVQVFNQLNNLINHPVFVMLSVIQAVREHCLPITALKEIRWVYKPLFKGINFAQVGSDYPEAVFYELTKGLFHLFDEFELSNQDVIAQGCLSDFVHYILNADTTEDNMSEFVLVTPQNFGTSCAMALNALEAIKKTTRHRVK